LNDIPQPTSNDTTAFGGQPYRIVERDGVRYTLLGTAHVSRASVDAVRAAVADGPYDTVAVELDAGRLQSLSDPQAMAKLDLVKVIRQGKMHVFAANLALAAYQRRLAEQLGVEPGAELKAAAHDAQARGLRVELIDREVGITFKRAMQALGWWGRIKVGSGILVGMFADEEVADEEIEKLKQGDMLESSFGEFASESPALYQTIIAERDRYMAAKLREHAGPASGAREVLAVIGAGHMAGMARHLQEDREAPATVVPELEQVVQKRSIPWVMLVLGTLILAGIGWGFYKGGFGMGASLLLQWAMWTGGLAGLGCLLAGSHPLSVLAAVIASPLKPFRPGIPSGAIAAWVEVHMRKPAYGDFMSLRDDVQSLRGWYRNRVSRVLMTFLLTNFGSMLGVWLAGIRILRKVTS
jgi:pheromone shutdown-related protein TraB